MPRLALYPFLIAVWVIFACPSELKAQQYWDGQNMTANNVVDGGTGTWNLTNNNWTTSNGSANSAWQGGAAIFTVVQGSTGTFTVAFPTSLSATALTFQSGGYTLTGAGTLTLSGSSVFNVVQGADTINSALADSTLITKTGNGQLVLSGDGSGQTGGLMLSAGSLQVTGTLATVLGTGTLTLNGAAGFQNYLDLNNTTGVNYGNNTVITGPFLILTDRGGLGSVAGTGVSNIFGTLSLGGTLMSIVTNSSITGTSNLTFGATSLTANSTIMTYDQANPGNPANTVTLGSVSSTGSFNLTVAGSSTVAVTGTTNLGSGNLVVANSASLTVSGTVSTTGSVVINGAMTLGGTGATSAVFQGVNSITVNGGSLQLGSNAGSANVVRLSGTTTPINLNGGTLSLATVTGSLTEIEQTGTLNLGVGDSTIKSSGGGGGKNNIISFNSLGSVATGATIDFAATTLGNGSAQFYGTIPTLTNVILGGWATSGNNFATLSGTTVVALNSWSPWENGDFSQTGSGVTPQTNVQIFDSGTTAPSSIVLSNSISINSLSMAGSTAGIYALDLGGTTLNILSGGIIGTGGGSEAYSITDGTLTVGNGSSPGTLYYTANSSQIVSLGALLQNNGPTGTLNLVIAGQQNDALVILSAANTYTGQTFLEASTSAATANQSTFIMTDRQLGAEPTSFQANNIVLTNGAVLSFTDFIMPTALSSNRGITVASGGGGIKAGSNSGFTNLTTAITGTGPVNFLYESGGASQFIISGANTYDGVTSLQSGNMYFTSIGNVGGTTPTSLGTPTTAANGLIVASGATYTGVYAATTDRIFSMVNVGAGHLSSDSAQLLTLNGNILLSTNASTYTFGGYGIGMQINGDIIQVGTQPTGLGTAEVVIGGGVVRLDGMNNYTGLTNIGGGVLEFNTIGNIGSGPSSLGNPTAVGTLTAAQVGTIQFSSTNLGAGSIIPTLRFTGTTAQSTDRALALLNGSGEVDTISTAPITFTGGASAAKTSNASAMILVLGGTGAGFFSGAGLLTDNPSLANNSLGITVQGITGQGTWTLNQSGTNTYTGNTIVNSGNLVLDFSNLASPVNLINSASKLTLGGGTLDILGKSGVLSTSQTFGAFTMTGNTGSVLNLNANGGAGVSVVTGTWIRTTTANNSNFSTLNVISNGANSLTLSGTLSNVINGIVNWMTYNSTDFATVVSGTVTAYTGYQDLLTTTPTATAVYKLTGSGTLTAATIGYGLKIDPSTTGSLTLNAALGNNGGVDFSIVFSGANPYLINGTGALGSGNSAALYISTAGTNALTISAPLLASPASTNSQVVKTGSGTLILSGVNTYGAGTEVQLGTLIAGSATGFSANSSFIVGASGVLMTNGFNVGILRLTGNGIVENGSSTSGTLTIGANDGAPGFATNSQDVFTGIIEDGSTGTLSLVKSGYGYESLNNSGYNALSTYSGNTTVNSGYLSVSILADAGVASAIGTGNTIFLGSAGQLGVLQMNNLITLDNETNRAIVLGAGGTGGIDVVNANTGNNNANSAPNTTVNGDFVGALLTLSGDISGAGTLAKFDEGNLDVTGTNTYTGGTVVYGGLMTFGSALSVPTTGLITIKSGGTAGTDYAMNQAFLNQISSNSAGVVALGADSSASLNFTNLPNVSLGAVSHDIFTGTITPGSNGYQLGGGGANFTFGGVGPISSLFIANADTITGTNNVTISPHGTAGASVVFDDQQDFTGTLTVAGGINATYLTAPLSNAGSMPGSTNGNGYGTTVNSASTWMSNAGLVLTGGGLTNVNAIYLNPLGSLTMVASATPINFLPDNTQIYFNGGALFFANDNQQQVAVGINYAETTGTVNFLRGESEIITNEAFGTAQTSTLTLSAMNRSAGATVDFIGQNLGVNAQNEIVIGGNIPTTTLSGTILATPWAFVGTPSTSQLPGTNGGSYGIGNQDAPTDFAVLSTNGSGTFGSVKAANGTLVSSAGSFVGGDYTITGTTGSFAGMTGLATANTIRNNNSSVTLGLTSTGTLAVNGLMEVGTTLTVGGTVGIGTVTAVGTSGGEIIVESSAAGTTMGQVVINSNIQDNNTSGGAVSVVKSGYGNLTLAGTNTFSGGLVVDGIGSVAANTAGSLGTGNITLNSGAVVLNSFAVASTVINNWVVNSDAVINNNSTVAVVLSGSITLNGTSTLNWVSQQTSIASLNGIISGTGNLTIQGGGGTIIIGGNTGNTSTGLTSITGVPDDLAATTVSLEKTNGNAISGNIVLGQSYSSGNYTIIGTPGITRGENLILDASLNGTSTVSGTDQIANSAIITFQGGNGYDAGVFQLDNQTETIAGVQSSAAGDGLIVNNSTTVGASMLTLSSTTGANYTFSGLIQDRTNSNTGANFGKLGITVTGSGTQTFSNANIYTGGTTISGSASFYADNAAAGGSATGTGTLTLANGAILGGTGTITSSINTINGTVMVGQAFAGDTNTTNNLTMTSTPTGSTTFTNANLVFNLSTTSTAGTELALGASSKVIFGSGNSLTFDLQGAGLIANGTQYTLITTTTGGSGQNGSVFNGLTLTGSVISNINTSFVGGAYNGQLVLVQDGTGWDIDVDITQAVPEPGTWVMMLGGLALLIFLQRKRRKKTNL